jgi:hypothetical protein
LQIFIQPSNNWLTAPTLHDLRTIRREAGKAFLDGVKRPSHKHPAVVGKRQRGERGSKAGS